MQSLGLMLLKKNKYTYLIYGGTGNTNKKKNKYLYICMNGKWGKISEKYNQINSYLVRAGTYM